MRHLDLFAGIGGFSLAARWMGWTTVVQVEWDEWCQKVLAKNFHDALRFRDIVEFNNKLENGEIITDTNGCRYVHGKFTEQSTEGGINAQCQSDEGYTHGRFDLGHIDILTGGFPCQPFSHAGKRKGTDDSRYLWPAMLETIRRVKPSYVVGENVAGLVSMENGKTLDRILSDLEDEGYTTEQVIIPACAVGAWHRRDRIWIVAHSKLHSGFREKRGVNGEEDGLQKENREERCGIWESGRTGNDEWEKPERLSDEKRVGRHIATDRNNQGLQGGTETGDAGGGRAKRNEQSERYGECNGGAYWLSEPSVGRVANGIPNRVDRLKGLGNAIVPQVVYQIFKAIESHNIRELYDSSRD